MGLMGLMVLLPVACGDDGGVGSATTGIASLSEGTAAMTTAATMTAGSGATTETTTESEGESAGGEALCPGIDVSLVIDPAAPIYNIESRTALIEFFDRLVEETGTKVRILTTVGSEFILQTSCLAGIGDGRPILVWGDDFTVAPGVADALDCLLEAGLAYTSELDGGTWMFSGLLTPILNRADWPDAEATALALLLSGSDDLLGGMYSRPGMASEAYLRLAGGGDRRRVATFAFGDRGDKLETFAYSLGPRSRYRNLTLGTLSKGLADWQDDAIGVCADSRVLPPLEEAAGCQRIDVLFVIDGSGSMLEEQQALAGGGGEPPVFAEFTQALLGILDGVEDLHVGVVSSEPGLSLLHTHRHFPKEPESPETACGLPPEQRWIVAPSPDFAEQFACIGATRTPSIYEHTALNGALALGNPENAGFLRDDSLLFVVIITDEDTQDFDEATRVEIREKYLEAVGGDLKRLIVLSIAGDPGLFEAPKTVCTGPYGSAAPGRRLTSIVRSFAERGFTDDLCEGSMSAKFAEILDDVVDACEALTPVP